ncbi:unnamed protein product [Phaeothamnion confervicola]
MGRNGREDGGKQEGKGENCLQDDQLLVFVACFHFRCIRRRVLPKCAPVVGKAAEGRREKEKERNSRCALSLLRWWQERKAQLVTLPFAITNRCLVVLPTPPSSGGGRPRGPSGAHGPHHVRKTSTATPFPFSFFRLAFRSGFRLIFFPRQRSVAADFWFENIAGGRLPSLVFHSALALSGACHQQVAVLRYHGGIPGLPGVPDAALPRRGRDGHGFAGCNALLVVSPTPPLFLNSVATTIAGNFSDDVRGSWGASRFRKEQLAFLRSLSDWQGAREDRSVCCLAGDIHVGGFSDCQVVNNGPVINQLVSSAIGNEPQVKLALASRAVLEFSELDTRLKIDHHEWLFEPNYAWLDIMLGGAAGPPPMMGTLVAAKKVATHAFRYKLGAVEEALTAPGCCCTVM